MPWPRDRNRVNILLGTLILAYLLAFCAYILIDIYAECRFQMEDDE
jgi:hypothetical protein